MIGANARGAHKPEPIARLCGVDLHWLEHARAAGSGRARAVPLLAGYLGCDVEAVQLGTAPGGRPRLARPLSPLDFNLAHAGGRLLLAVGRGRFGVDVESLETPRDHLALARHQFEGGELALVESAPEGRSAHAFLALWTAKEALAKALGRGLDAFREIRLEAAADATLKPARLPAEAGDCASWQVLLLAPERGYLAALAVEQAVT